MSLLAIAAFAASALVPAQPTSFETVNLRMPVDSCAFDPASVRVSQQSNVIRVTQLAGACSPPGATHVVDVRLGALPAGDYRVELYASTNTFVPPVEMLSFLVRDPVEVALFPPPPRPLTDYSGIWFDPRESGWGLSLHQSALHNVFGLLFVYDANRQPQWYSFQGGRWTNSTVWTASIYRTTGPALGTTFDPTQVSYATAGSVTVDFTQIPGTEGLARLTYTIGGIAATKTIQRMAL